MQMSNMKENCILGNEENLWRGGGRGESYESSEYWGEQQVTMIWVTIQWGTHHA